ncbi:hypothetical protein [Halomicrobium urmianum]|uniref:hypothetical protein n=1 Tax=Halomicrobium urmianum TaxID=1586233 RepID=UPI001CDA5093|nr:hypothetical protein [Halomicrobium urmianum]
MSYRIERPPGEERGIVIACEDHDHRREFRPAEKRVAFFCPDCGVEVEVALREDDWRPLSERC